MKKKSAEFGRPIYLISDEPYRELVYDDIKVPYLINYYDDTLVSYSYSKALSIPGERIGYIAVSNRMQDVGDVYAAVCGAGRSLGYVCASSLFHQVVARCINETSDISIYKKNRDLLYVNLTKFGFHCVRPDGAFYLFVKAMEPDANEFCERAKKYELLLVPGDDFGCPGYVRIAYCVTTEQIVRSLPAFEKLAKEYQ
jgi:aspartate aminotransferase